MQLYIAPPPYGPHKKSFYTSKLNALSWRNDDKNLLISGWENIYDWKIKEEPDNRPKIPGCNVTSVAFLGDTNSIIAAADDMSLRKILDNSTIDIADKFDYTMKELHLFTKSKLMACATSSLGQSQDQNTNNQNSSNVINLANKNGRA